MRISEARKSLKRSGKLPCLISNLINIKYLTGFTGSHAFLIIDENQASFITDGRYAEYAESILHGECGLVIQRKSPIHTIADVIEQNKYKKIFIEENSVYCSFKKTLSESLPDLTIDNAGDEIEKMRMIKDESEITLIKKAVSIADDCVAHIKNKFRKDITEWDLSVEIENYYRTHECQKTSFDTIVASGPGSSMPHYVPSRKRAMMSNAPLMIDMGCLCDEYNSDLTRTFFVDSVTAEFESIYQLVLKAQRTAAESVRPGITTGELDLIARTIITDGGYGSRFNHSLGHGVGLEVHESPTVRSGGDMVLQSGMVITIEPGIYLPGIGGVRIEDMVLVTDNGFEILTKASKELIII